MRTKLWQLKSVPRVQLVGAGVLVLVLAALVAGFIIFGRSPSVPSQVTGNANTEGTGNAKGSVQVRNALTGEMVPADEAMPFPIAVMVENHPVVRPQSGLGSAAMVYEALTEGGITRFLAIFSSGRAVDEIGPVRSVRPYFLDWAQEWGAMLVHAGGSQAALDALKTRPIFDLNQFSAAQYFYRDLARAQATEHTLFTSSRLLDLALRDRGKDQLASYTARTFKDDAQLSARPTNAKPILIDFSTFRYKVEYRYDPASNSYARFLGGEPHLERGGTQLAPKNVIVQFTPTRLADAEHLALTTVGEGQALFFEDGQAAKGSWKKDTLSSPTVYTHEDGSPVAFNVGQTWIEILPTDRAVEY